MRWWIPCSAAFLTITIPAVALAQPVIMRQVPRDVYGNILVVPEYAYPQGYADQGYVTRPDPDPYPRPSRRGADRRSDPRYAPIDPSTGYPYGALEPESRTASLPSDEDFDSQVGMQVSPEYQRQVVAYRGNERPGTVIIDTPSKFLYLVQPGGQAIRYGIGVGRPGFEWAGRKTVSMKREWPDWRPPSDMLKRRPDLPAYMPGGPDNPLGARALYLGSSLYRIHGTNEPHTIGHAVSSGCIRMLNQDVMDLYRRVPVGAPVVVI